MSKIYTKVVYPQAKINVGLSVLYKRPDGFHHIETLFYPAPLRDILEIAPGTGSQVAFFGYGLPIAGAVEDNLCVKAYRLLQQDFDLAPVDIHLYKQIPMGAGLGGGSSDAASCLLLLNELFDLHLTLEQLRAYGLRLGSDVPFFIQPQPLRPYFATGRGELLEPFELDLSPYRIEVRFPGVMVPTARAYAALTPGPPPVPLKEALQRPVTQWKECVFNHFETTVFEQYPTVAQCKAALYEQGAVYASLSGSGSAVFGLF